MRVLAAAVATMAGLALAAAPAQAAEPQGKYWRVKTFITLEHMHPLGSGYTMMERRVSVDWATPDGRSWTAYRPLGAYPKTKRDEEAWKKDGSPTSWTYRTEGMKISLSTGPGKGWVKKQEDRPIALMLGERPVTFEELQKLPADAAGLKRRITAEVNAWIDKSAEEAKTTAPGVTKKDWLDHLDLFVAESLTQLLYRNPVPQKVRAAAYEALRTTKGVRDLGQAKDPLGRTGHKLALPDLATDKQTLKQQIVVNTGTMTLMAQYTDDAPAAGGKQVKGQDKVEAFVAGWTNDEPAVPDATYGK
ncbi:hypothetical protein HCN51_55410 [Nonomuraea sp. FMUSA5-5]|uniref:Uncharacterized protein n=1 Tax=Nonomuraea composti TaxID=2720023 RepID=A0ABX1BQI1_9ACTN|nr:hypothetical protein [Nonomuraea sp. FMUSA5-5]NJP98517.1 hypothetical protein [Nonomuraea sp. FMUSA5-5]